MTQTSMGYLQWHENDPHWLVVLKLWLARHPEKMHPDLHPLLRFAGYYPRDRTNADDNPTLAAALEQQDQRLFDQRSPVLAAMDNMTIIDFHDTAAADPDFHQHLTNVGVTKWHKCLQVIGACAAEKRRELEQKMAAPMRPGIFRAIERERAYQQEKYGADGDRNLSIGDYILIMQWELQEAQQHYMARNGAHAALAEILQVAAVGVAAMERHGFVERHEL